MDAIAITSLTGGVTVLVLRAAADSFGYFLAALLLGACFLDIEDSRRQPASLSTPVLSDCLALNRREEHILRAAGWGAFVPAIAVMVRVARNSFTAVDGLALVYFVASALLLRFVLLPRAKKSGAALSQMNPQG